MSVKIIPITEYDFDMFNLFIKNHYGNTVAVSPAIFKVNCSDKENPKCINCGNLVRNDSYKYTKSKITYCVYCGAGIDWSECG